jgi:hypothetical protein
VESSIVKFLCGDDDRRIVEGVPPGDVGILNVCMQVKHVSRNSE